MRLTDTQRPALVGSMDMKTSSPPFPSPSVASSASLRIDDVYDGPAGKTLNRAARLARHALDASLSVVALLDGGQVHLDPTLEIDATSCPAEMSICQSVIDAGGPAAINNLRAREPLTEHPVLTNHPDARTALGIPLTVGEGEPDLSSPTTVGAFYVIDETDRTLSTEERPLLRHVAHLIENALEQQARPDWEQSALHHVSDPVFVLDREEQLRYVNPALAQAFGYENREQVLDASVSALYADPDSHERLLRRVRAEGTVQDMDIQFERKDGTASGGTVTCTVERNELGAPQYYIGTVALKDSGPEYELRERERKVEALYEQTDQLLQSNTPEEVAAHLESLVVDTLGYPLSAVRYADENVLVPTHTSDAISTYMPERPRYAVSGDSAVAEAYRTGETQIFEDIQDLEDGYDRGKARAAAYIPMGNHGTISVARLTPCSLPPFNIRLLEILAGNATVVLDRIQRETKQQRTIERIDTLRNLSQSILSATSPKAVAQATLERLASLLPYDQASVLECDLSSESVSLLAIDDPNALSPRVTEAHLLNHFQGENGHLLQGYRYVETISLPSDDPVEEYLHSRGLRTYLNVPLQTDEDVIGFLNLGSVEPGIFGDEHIEIAQEVADMLTVALRQAHYREQLIDAKEEAEQMNRLKSAFLANMSHEIRTPLTSIVGFAEVLDDYDLGEADQFADLIERSGNQLLDTIDSVLDLSKLEAGAVRPALEWTDVSQEVTETVELVTPHAEEAGLSLRADVPDRPVETELDPGAFQRILHNLLTNAIKFTEDGGTVEARVRSADESVVVEVEDTGVGIDEEFLPNLFDAFEQEGGTASGPNEGTGLGLAVTKRLVHLLDGTIDVESTKGVGTCFTIHLPRSASPSD